MKKIIGAATVLLIAVLSLAFLYFSNLSVKSRSNDRVLSEIPADAAVVFQYPNDRSLYDIFRDYTVFDTIVGTKNKAELSWLKDFLLNDTELYAATAGQKIFLSFHPSSSDSVQFLWSMPLKEGIRPEEFRSMLEKEVKNQIISSQELGKSVLQIKNAALDRAFYLCIDRGIARGSFSRSVLIRSIDKNSAKIDPAFIKVINAGSREDENALANLFINYNKPGFLNPFFRQKLNGNFELFQSFSGYSSLKLNYKSDALMFNGITETSGASDSYIRLFLNQEPIKNTIKRIMPENTSNSVAYGLSDYPAYHKDLSNLFEKRKELDTLKKQLSLLTTETGINPDRDIKKLWGNELITLQLSTYEYLAIVKVTNGRSLQFYLDPLSSSYTELVRKMNYANLFYFYLGDPFKRYFKPFYSITDNLLILSNSPGTVQRFLEAYNQERFLYKSEAFHQFDQLVADQGNVSFFFHFNNSGSLLRSLLKRSYSQNFNGNKYGLKDLYALSYQLTSNKEHFFTNFYTGYKNAASPADPLLISVDSIDN